MASSTSNLDQLIQSQASKEITINGLFDAASPATLYGRRQSVSSGLTWGYYGGVILVSSVVTQIANGSLTLAAGSSNYIQANPSDGSVSSNTTGFTAGYWQLYVAVTGASTVTSYTDSRILGQSLTSSCFANPMNAAGDLIIGGASGVPTRLPVGTAGQVLTVVSGTPAWAASTGGGSDAALGSVNVFTKNQSVSSSGLTSGTSISVDASLSNNFRVVLGSNATLANPTNLTDGMVVNFYIKQDGIGSRALSYGTQYKFPSGTTPTLSTVAGSIDFMSCYFDGPDGVLVCNVTKGYA